MTLEHIPAPAGLPQSHASTLVELPDGGFLAAWFAGSREGADDVGIWGSRRSRGGRWSPAFLLAKTGPLPHWNPVLLRDGGETVLFFKTGRDCKYWRTWIARSADAGQNWSRPELLVPGNVGGRGPVKNKCLILADGAWLAPASSEIGRWQAFVDRSDDRGRHWTRTRLLPQPRRTVGRDGQGAEIPFGVIQPTLWASRPGHVHMLLRSNCGRICRSDSADGGRAWSPVAVTEMPNNNSGIDLARLRDGGLVLACNPVDGNWGPRSPLSLFRSDDNGAAWRPVADLAAEPGEFSYPAVIATAGGGVAVTFTHRRTHIVFRRFGAREL